MYVYYVQIISFHHYSRASRAPEDECMTKVLGWMKERVSEDPANPPIVPGKDGD